MPRITDLPPATLPLSGTETFSLVQSNVTKEAALNQIPTGISTQNKLNLKADLVGGKVPASQLPAYVDDILEYPSVANFPVTGSSGKIYVALDTNDMYRWTGTQYLSTTSGGGGSSLVLGETSSSAYRGDRGKIAFDHTALVANNPHGTTLAQITAAGATSLVSIVGVTEALTDNSTKYATTAFVKGQNYLNSLTTFTQYSIPYANNVGTLIQDNAGLKYDGTNLTAGASNAGTLSGIKLNGTSASLMARDTGLLIYVGTAGVATPSTTKGIYFYNQETPYFTLTSSSTIVNNATVYANLFPDTNNKWDLGTTGLRWKTFYTTNFNVSGTVTGLTSTHVGLANVNDTSDWQKPLSEASVNAFATVNANIALKLNASEKGANNGVATLGADGKVTPAQLPTGSQVYKGTYNATTNTPTLIDGTGTSGWTYKVTVSGTQNFGSGSIAFTAGDDVIYNGTVWQRIPSFQTINSVNGQIGTVVLTTDNISDAGTNKYFTTTLARNTISATAPVVYTSATGVISMAAATGSVDGYLTAANFAIFNAKQAAGNYITALTGAVTGSGAGSVVTTLSNGVVTYAKMQSTSTTNVVLGRTSVGAGIVEEIATTGSGAVVRGVSPTLSSPIGLVKGDVGLSLVDNTTDAAKPISTATAAALALKANASAITNVNNTSDVNKPISTATQVALDLKSDRFVQTNAQVGTTYTIQASDNTKIVTINNASAITVTIPAGLPLGFNCLIIQLGTGQITFSASSTTINQMQGYNKTAARYGMATLASYASNVFVLSGDLA